MQDQMSFLDRLDRCPLTRAQAIIANYIAQNQKRILGMTAMGIAHELGVSDASVIRLSRALGYEGFSDMKDHLEQELKKKNEKIGKHSLHDRFVLQSDKYSASEDNTAQIMRLMGINLETSLNQNTPESYERIADRILSSHRKMIIGLRGGKGSAMHFSRLLSFITDHVHHIIEESNDLLCKLSTLTEEDVVIVLNFPRYYKIDVKIASILQERNIPVILITDSMASPFAKQAIEILLAETEHCGFFHSMLGVMGLLEYLLIIMCRRDPETFRERLETRDHILTDLLAEQLHN